MTLSRLVAHYALPADHQRGHELLDSEHREHRQHWRRILARLSRGQGAGLSTSRMEPEALVECRIEQN